MRVAVVCPYDVRAPGGVQQLAVELVARLRAEGDDALLVAPGAPAGEVSVGGSMRVRTNASVAPVALAPGVAGRVQAAVRRADVVHIHEPLVPMVSVAALGVSIPKVVTFHADPPRWVRTAYRTVGRLFDRKFAGSVLTAVSPVAAAAVPERWGSPEIVPNAIDVAAYRDASVDRIPQRVTFLGRDDRRKGLDVLLAAWPRVVAAAPAAELVVLGVARPTGPPGVRFAGRVGEDQKRALLAQSTVHVTPNLRGESFGIVVAEGMAAGAAVVASDLESFRHVLGGAGKLVPPGDPHRLADALVALLSDPDETARLSAAGVRRVAEFDWANVVGRYRACYHRALEMNA